MRYHFPSYGAEAELPGSDWLTLSKAIQAINETSGSFAALAAQTGGDQAHGDCLTRKYFLQAKQLLECRLSNNKTIAECIGAASPLEEFGVRLVPGTEHPLPKLMLAQVEYHRRGDALVLLKKLAGDNPLRPFSPVTARLLRDGRGTRFIDTTDLGQDNSRQGWKLFLLRDVVADLVLEQDYWLERSGFYHPARFAVLCDLFGAARVFRLKVFVDCISAHGSGEEYMEKDRHLDEARKLVFADHAPPHLLDLEPCEESVRGALGELVAKGIGLQFQEWLEATLADGGALSLRTRRSLHDALRLRPELLSSDARHGLARLETQAEKVFAKMVALLESNRRSARLGSGKFQPLDVADLNSPSRVRKYLAVTNEVWPGFVAFLEETGLRERYEVLGKETPNCPMPLDGHEPLDQRLMAAVFGLLIADLKDGVLRVPETCFQLTPGLTANEEEAKALKGMLDKLADHMKKRLVVETLLRQSPRMQRVAEGWLALWEGRYRHAPCGVDSADNLLLPCFFFNDTLFRSLLEAETDWYRDAWLKARALIPPLLEAYSRNDLPAVRRCIQDIVHEFHRLSLRVVQGKDAGKEVVACPIAGPVCCPFDPPKSFFSKKMLVIKEAGAPIQAVTAPPGNPARYAALVRPLEPHIRRLRRLQSSPREENANLVGYSRNGPVFDQNRLHLYALGHLLFRTVQYLPEPVPGRSRLVQLLMDFSGSMNADRVRVAKNAAIVLAEGLSNFDIEFHLYNTAGSFYRLCQIFKSSDRKLGGKAALASITHRDMHSGDGWNPDAAILLAAKQLFDQNPEADQAVLIHLSDHEYCSSLVGNRFTNSAEEVWYAVRKLTEKYHYVAARVGTDADPLPASIRHQYIYFPDEPLTEQKVAELYGILRNIIRAQEIAT